MKGKKSKVLFLVQFSIFLALEALVSFTPLGSIPIGVVVASLGCIPVCVAAVTLGTWAGTLMGFSAGLFSFIVWTFTPPSALAFAFTPFYSVGDIHGNFFSLLICFVPRILVGTVTGVVYQRMSKRSSSQVTASCVVAGILGSLTNTVGVLGGFWLFFGEQIEAVAGMGVLALIGSILLTNSIAEAVAAAILTPAISRPLQLVAKQSQ